MEPRRTWRRGSCPAATLDDASDIGRIISQVAEPGDSGLTRFDMTPEHREHRLEVPGFEKLVEQVGDAAEEHLGERLLVLGGFQAGGQRAKRRRRLEQRDAEAFGEPVQEVEQRGIAVDVPGREPADLLRDAITRTPSDERAVRPGRGNIRVGSGWVNFRPWRSRSRSATTLGLQRPGGVGDGGAVAGEVFVLPAQRGRPRRGAARIPAPAFRRGPGRRRR